MVHLENCDLTVIGLTTGLGLVCDVPGTYRAAVYARVHDHERVARLQYCGEICLLGESDTGLAKAAACIGEHDQCCLRAGLALGAV